MSKTHIDAKTGKKEGGKGISMPFSIVACLLVLMLCLSFTQETIGTKVLGRRSLLKTKTSSDTKVPKEVYSYPFPGYQPGSRYGGYPPTPRLGPSYGRYPPGTPYYGGYPPGYGYGYPSPPLGGYGGYPSGRPTPGLGPGYGGYPPGRPTPGLGPVYGGYPPGGPSYGGYPPRGPGYSESPPSIPGLGPGYGEYPPGEPNYGGYPPEDPNYGGYPPGGPGYDKKASIPSKVNSPVLPHK